MKISLLMTSIFLSGQVLLAGTVTCPLWQKVVVTVQTENDASGGEKVAKGSLIRLSKVLNDNSLGETIGSFAEQDVIEFENPNWSNGLAGWFYLKAKSDKGMIVIDLLKNGSMSPPLMTVPGSVILDYKMNDTKILDYSAGTHCTIDERDSVRQN